MPPQYPALRGELRALGSGDDARGSSARAPAPIAEAPLPDNVAGARGEPSPSLPLRPRRRRRRRRRRLRKERTEAAPEAAAKPMLRNGGRTRRDESGARGMSPGPP